MTSSTRLHLEDFKLWRELRSIPAAGRKHGLTPVDIQCCIGVLREIHDGYQQLALASACLDWISLQSPKRIAERLQRRGSSLKFVRVTDLKLAWEKDHQTQYIGETAILLFLHRAGYELRPLKNPFKSCEGHGRYEVRLMK